MAIENKAKQIQASTRQYNQDIARQQRKRSDRSALKTLGLKTAINVVPKIANSYLASQTAEFLRDEQSILQEKREFGQALQVKKQFLDIQKTITDSGARSPEEWAYNNMKPVFTKRAEAYLDDAQTGPAGIYEALLDQEVKKLSKDWGTQFTLGLEKVNKLGTEEEFSTMFASAVKSARPSNFTDFATQGISNFFTGKTKESREQDAIKYISENLLSQNADAVNDFQKQYAKFKDTALAYNMTDFKHKILKGTNESLETFVISPDELTQEIQTSKADFSETLGIFVMTLKTEITNRNTGDVTSTIKEELNTMPLDSDLTSPRTKVFNQLRVGEHIAVFNPLKDGREMLTSQAYGDFVKDLKEKKLKLSSFPTVADYNETMKLFQKYLQAPTNLQDPSRESVRMEIVKALTDEKALNLQREIDNARQVLMSLKDANAPEAKIKAQESALLEFIKAQNERNLQISKTANAAAAMAVPATILPKD